MRVRKLVSEEKWLKADTGWRNTDLQPRYAPVYAKTRPIRAGWQWRSVKVASVQSQFVLLLLCNPKRGNWQSILILDQNDGSSVVARFEDHGSHPGIHVHSDCERSGVDVGPETLDDLLRIPPANRFHRRRRAWTMDEFWEVSRQFFRIKSDPDAHNGQGMLL